MNSAAVRFYVYIGATESGLRFKALLFFLTTQPDGDSIHKPLVHCATTLNAGKFYYSLFLAK